MIVSRRRFLGRSTLSAAAWASSGLRAPQPHLLRADRARLRRQLEALSLYGRPAGSGFADGVSRVGFSDADVAGREFVVGVIQDAGLDARIDAAGNILEIRSGTHTGLPPILFGCT
jgi:N-carbamoyl-L-amino-acid hydrolase